MTLILLLACKPPQPAAEPAQPAVILDGQPIAVEWDDGDTFNSPRAGGDPLKARLAGFNTLESYGPVHRWGEWEPRELYAIAKDAGNRAGAEVWECQVLPGGGGYGRELVDCPGLRRAMLEEGYAHVFMAGEETQADPADLAAQKQAQDRGRGIWAKGVPAGIVTSLHSLDEKKDQEKTYNRVADTATGEAGKRWHTDSYRSCQEVCEPDAASCMVYVPYRERYGDGRAICIQ